MTIAARNMWSVLSTGTLLVITMALHINAIPDSEYQALKDLYHATNGPKWRKNLWPANLKGNPCNWGGVTCNNGHVTSLSHEHTYSGGSLPPSIADLTEVGLLDLGSNQLSGPFPKELGKLKKLFQVEADGNNFTGKNKTNPETFQ